MIPFICYQKIEEREFKRAGKGLTLHEGAVMVSSSCVWRPQTFNRPYLSYQLELQYLRDVTKYALELHYGNWRMESV